MILNENQKLAVLSDEKRIFLLAGAGSGKTRVIIERIQFLINQGVDTEKILCITFTQKAALEMKERLKGATVDVYTFHGYCYQLLKKVRDFKIFEFNHVFSQKELLDITTYKNSLQRTQMPQVYAKYQKYLRERKLLDFDDLMIESFSYLKKHTYEYLFVDEFQDTNLLQFKLLELMVKKETAIFCVGDPDQSIYAFRGGKMDLIERFVVKYEAKVYRLNENYRSNQGILDVSNRLIAKNLNRIKKELFTSNTSFYVPKLFVVESKMEKKVIQYIKKYKLFECAILYRNHYQVSYLRQLLKRHYLFDVKLLSLHESKGLEFDDVILYGLEIMPHDLDDTYFSVEEERRLLFVGMTRAKKTLAFFTYKMTRFLKALKLKPHFLEIEKK